MKMEREEEIEGVFEDEPEFNEEVPTIAKLAAMEWVNSPEFPTIYF